MAGNVVPFLRRFVADWPNAVIRRDFVSAQLYVASRTRSIRKCNEYFVLQHRFSRIFLLGTDNSVQDQQADLEKIPVGQIGVEGSRNLGGGVAGPTLG